MASPTGVQAGTASRRVFDLPEIRRRIFDELPTVNVTDMMVVNQTALSTAMDVWCTRKVAHELSHDEPEHSVYQDAFRLSARVITGMRLLPNHDCDYQEGDDHVLHFCQLRQLVEVYPSVRRFEGYHCLKDHSIDDAEDWDSHTQFDSNGESIDGPTPPRAVAWTFDVATETFTMLESVCHYVDGAAWAPPESLEGLITCSPCVLVHNLRVELHIASHPPEVNVESIVRRVSGTVNVLYLTIDCDEGWEDIGDLGAVALEARKGLEPPLEELDLYGDSLGDDELERLMTNLNGSTRRLELSHPELQGFLEAEPTWSFPADAQLNISTGRFQDDKAFAATTGGMIIVVQGWSMPIKAHGNLASIHPSFGDHLRVLDLSGGYAGYEGADHGPILLTDLASFIRLCKSSLAALEILVFGLTYHGDISQEFEIEIADSAWSGNLITLDITLYQPLGVSTSSNGIPVFGIAKNISCLCNSRTDIRLKDDTRKNFGKPHFFLPSGKCEYGTLRSREVHDMVHWMISLSPSQQASLRVATALDLGIYPCSHDVAAWRGIQFDQYERPIPAHVAAVAHQVRLAQSPDSADMPGHEGMEKAKTIREQFEYLLGMPL